MAQQNADAFADAIFKDMGKPRQEAFLAEIGPIVQRSLENAELLEEWSKPESVDVPDWQKAWKPQINKVPRGPVLVIA